MTAIRNTSSVAIAEIDATIASLERLRALVQQHSAVIDTASCPSLSLRGCAQPWLFLHHPNNAKAIAKALGGSWEREANGRGFFDYKGVCEDGLIQVTIIDAERLPPSQPLELWEEPVRGRTKAQAAHSLPGLPEG